MNTHKTYRSALILGAKPLHRLTAAVGVASLGLFAGQAHAQESVEERLSALEQQLAEVEPHAKGEQGFSFNTYARSGLLLNSDGKSAPGGPYLTPAGSVGGAVGRLGNEPDTYLEAILNYKKVKVQSEYGDDALYGMGTCYFYLRDYKNAIKSFNNLLKSYPQTPLRTPSISFA